MQKKWWKGFSLPSKDGPNKMNKIGVLGGSFDPVHLGHLSLAKDALIQVSLDQVIFMPVYRQPFKLNASLASDKDRLAMLQEATCDSPGFSVSDWEIKKKGVSYTYLTLRALKEQYVGSKIYFITGTDTFLKINIWKNATELLEENNFIIGHRPGYREQELLDWVDEIKQQFDAEIHIINNTRLDISATEIRSIVSGGGTISNLVPPGVERYIKKHGLYI
jgi:nicotinate-nucleotide adenylyltransferase